MSLKDVVSPKSSEELIEIVSQANLDRKRIEVVGGGTKKAIGNDSNADIQVRTTALSGIVEYTASELVMTANAGTSSDDVKAELDKNGQMLAFEPPNYTKLLGGSGDQTIGGIFAGNLSGTRRLAAGAARDALLGVNFVNGKGQLIKTGGKVMKNVTGLDLVKLMAGSWGTLGVMRDVTFKVLPKQDVATTLVLHGLDDAKAAEAMSLAMAQSVEVSSAAHLPQNISDTVLGGKLSGKSATIFRLEGLELSVKVRSEKLKSLLKQYGDMTELNTDESSVLWTEISDVKPLWDLKGADIWKVSVAPNDGHEAVAKLTQISDCRAFYDWQGGLVWLAVQSNSSSVRQIVQAIGGGGYATLLKRSTDEAKNIDVFQPQNAAVQALSDRIKLQFDPNNILNPGRMYQNVGASKQAAS